MQLSLDISPTSRVETDVLHSFSIWAILGKLHHDLPPIYNSPCKKSTLQVNNNPNSKRTEQTTLYRGQKQKPTIKPVNSLLRLVLVLVPHERKPTRVSIPTIISGHAHKHTQISKSSITSLQNQRSVTPNCISRTNNTNHTCAGSNPRISVRERTGTKTPFASHTCGPGGCRCPRRRRICRRAGRGHLRSCLRTRGENEMSQPPIQRPSENE
jgi:hypothetical protein